MDDLDAWLAEAYPTAYRTACLVLRSSADAEDAVQDAFLRVWRFRDAIPAGDGRRAWLYRVVVNACLSRLRGERVWRQRLADDALASLPGQADPQHDAEDAALGECLTSALDRLPEHLRVPVVLRYFSGLAEREIAVAIQRRPGTVKSRLSEARRRLADDPALAAWVSVEVAR
ncbi:MAG: polymerase sigma-70 factor, subfamily [Frankiaceae bacterium]|nr:polymerase sigma-70 factor, subfamily [Frankiaceae bacterium]